MFLIKLSKEGYDVTKERDVNLSFSSELATHNIYKVMSVYMSASQTSLTFKHGLNYVPKVWVFLKDSDADGEFIRRIPIVRYAAGSFDYYIDSTNITIQKDDTTAHYFKVMIFTRSASV